MEYGRVRSQDSQFPVQQGHAITVIDHEANALAWLDHSFPRCDLAFDRSAG
jgi:hypothetical protein